MKMERRSLMSTEKKFRLGGLMQILMWLIILLAKGTMLRGMRGWNLRLFSTQKTSNPQTPSPTMTLAL